MIKVKGNSKVNQVGPPELISCLTPTTDKGWCAIEGRSNKDHVDRTPSLMDRSTLKPRKPNSTVNITPRVGRFKLSNSVYMSNHQNAVNNVAKHRKEDKTELSGIHNLAGCI